MANRIQIRRGTDAQRQGVILAECEPAFTTDTKQLFVGDGVTPGGVLVAGGSVVYAPIGSLDIVAGDLLWWDSGTGAAYPARLQPDQGSEAANQSELAAGFLGIALDAPPDGVPMPASIPVLLTGIVEMECPSQIFQLGALIGGKEDPGGEHLYDQVVTGVATAQQAIGRAAKAYASATTTVRVLICSTHMYGGVYGQLGPA